MLLEQTILSNLILNQKYCQEVFPYLKEEYFQGLGAKAVFKIASDYITKYKASPTKEALVVELQASNVPEHIYTEAINLVGELELDPSNTHDWLMDKTEGFCQEQDLRNSIMACIDILEGSSTLDKGSMPDLLMTSLSVSFDTRIGHDYFADAEDRYKAYQEKDKRVLQFDIDVLNEVTNGGISTKTLNCVGAGPNVGKSLFLCHLASHWLREGKKVLYITLEMSEIEINKRIEANMMGIPINSIDQMTEANFKNNIRKIRAKTSGQLITREYPMSSASALHFRNLFVELNIKKKFIPDVVFIDYLNICSSARLKASSANDLYSWVKAIAEELRGLAQEFNLPIWTATQFNRSGFASTDPGMDDTSESFGLPAVLDFYLALIRNEELDQLGQLMVKQLKSRYGDKSLKPKFVIGLDRPKFRLYNLNNQNLYHSNSSTSSNNSSSPSTTTENSNVQSSKTKNKLRFN